MTMGARAPGEGYRERVAHGLNPLTATEEGDLLTLAWDSGSLVFFIGGEAPVRIVAADAAPASLDHRAPGLVHLTTPGQGHDWASERLIHTSVGGRLRYTGHRLEEQGELRIDQRDDLTGLAVTSCFRRLGTDRAFRTWTGVRNEGQSTITLETVTTFVADASVLGAAGSPQDLALTSGRMDWFGEGRWATRTLGEHDIVDLALGSGRGLPDPRGRFAVSSSSTWSTGTASPAAVLHSSHGRWLLWQIEHNGPWGWEVGQVQETAYAALTGPTAADAQWSRSLAPGEVFTTVPATIAFGHGGIDEAFGTLTSARRAACALIGEAAPPPVVYNDYLNTLRADPTMARVRPLIAAAAAVGAEYYCLDAGWYDAPGSSWWDRVGEWEVDRNRFPGGLEELKEETERHGLRLGLWLEPEVVGVHSPLASTLPESAFLHRSGERVVTQGRYHLDFSSPLAHAHLDAVIDHLVDDIGVDYFKFDYNVTPGVGGANDGASAGDGLLAHSRAFVAWLRRLKRSRPGLLIENCASGGMRMDYAILAIADLQSTSDQQDPSYSAPIAATAPASVLPEQAGNWACPQPTMSDDEIVFTMVNGLAGVPYLSGFIDGMTRDQQELVAAGLRVFIDSRAELARSLPTWPIGVEQSRTGWNCLRLGRLLYVWKHAGASRELILPIGAASDPRGVVQLYPPAGVGASWSFDAPAGADDLVVAVAVDHAAACVLLIQGAR